MLSGEKPFWDKGFRGACCTGVTNATPRGRTTNS